MTRHIEDLQRENEELKRRVAMLEERIVRAVQERRPPEPLLTDGYPSGCFQGGYTAPPGDPPAPPNTGSGVRQPQGETDEDIEAVYAAVKARALRDIDPAVLALLRHVLKI